MIGYGFATRYLVGLGMAGLGLVSYKWIGEATLDRAQLDLLTPLDTAIPFMPWTVWLYLPLFVFNFHFAIWSIEDRQAFARTVVSLLIGWTIAYSVFWLWPAAYPRPPLANDESWSTDMLSFLHGFDPATNTFPSLHVVDMGCVALGAWRDNDRRGRWVLVSAVLPALSILTTKQHFLADLVAGAGLAVVSHGLAFRGFRGSMRATR